MAGDIDPSTLKGTMTETWDGKTTGYYEFALTKDGMKGTWRGSPDAEPQAFMLTSLPSADLSATNAASISGFYYSTFDTWIYVDGDTPEALPKEKHFLGWNWLRIRHVNGDVFAFHYYVSGDNGHQGSMQGLARMTSQNQAEFVADDGLPEKPLPKLGFEFDGESVTVTELEDCTWYRGARCVFDDTLKRGDELAVPDGVMAADAEE